MVNIVWGIFLIIGIVFGQTSLAKINLEVQKLKQEVDNKEEEIVIDAPPSGDDSEELPLLLTIGSSITMVASSLMTGITVFSSVSSGQKTIVQASPQLIMMGTMIFASLIMPRVTAAYQKKRKRKKLLMYQVYPQIPHR